MEKQLFTWQGWDSLDLFILQFNGISLIKKLGNLEIGTVFDQAVVDFENGDLELTNYVPNSKTREAKEQHTFKLTLGVE